MTGSRYVQLKDAGWLRREYESGRSLLNIATEVGCTESSVLQALRRHGIQARPARRPSRLIGDSLVCRQCNIPKPIDEFVRSRNRTGGVMRLCKACQRGNSAERRASAAAAEVDDPWESHPTGEKTCTRCKVPKPVLEFGRDRSRGDGLTARCLVCQAVVGAEWRANNLERSREITRNAARRHRYKALGITEDDWQAMFEAQGGVCAICKGTQPVENKRLAADHCHDSGKVRGLLCTACNVALGGFQDRIDLLEAAVAYLR